LAEAKKATIANHKLTAILAINYSGRAEIVDAVKKISSDVLRGDLATNKIDADLFASYLHTGHWPDPDLLIRTSGEMRISNFLLWQLAYTEIYVTKKFWPDFAREDLVEAVEEFAQRQRRYGGV
jgi:undecaprenyl diphosphate synthase